MQRNDRRPRRRVRETRLQENKTQPPQPRACHQELRPLAASARWCQRPHNTHVPTKHVVSCVRRETRTCRRKSIDYRFARGVRKRGPCPREAEDIVVTPTLAANTIHINEDRSIIVLAREWGVRLLCRAERVCVDGTFRSAPVTHYQVLTFTFCAKTAPHSPSHMSFSRTNGLPRMSPSSTQFNAMQQNAALVMCFVEGRSR